MGADIVVPSRHLISSDYPRAAEEVREPYAHVCLSEGVTIENLVQRSHLSLEAAGSDAAEHLHGLIDKTAAMFMALEIEDFPPDDRGVREGTVVLTPEAMDKVREWTEHNYA